MSGQAVHTHMLQMISFCYERNARGHSGRVAWLVDVNKVPEKRFLYFLCKQLIRCPIDRFVITYLLKAIFFIQTLFTAHDEQFAIA